MKASSWTLADSASRCPSSESMSTHRTVSRSPATERISSSREARSRRWGSPVSGTLFQKTLIVAGSPSDVRMCREPGESV